MSVLYVRGGCRRLTAEAMYQERRRQSSFDYCRNPSHRDLNLPPSIRPSFFIDIEG